MNCHPSLPAGLLRWWLRTGTCLLASALPVASTLAAECEARASGGIRPTINVRVDNDLFGGREQDQGYSNGILITAVSPNLLDYEDDPCLPRLARGLSNHLDWLSLGEFDQLNMVAGIGQALYTPDNKGATELIADDRPYAAALLVTIGYNARRDNRLRTSHLRLGMVGPSALGHEVQDRWHDIIDVEKFNGWDNQLRDEPVFQLVHERMRRYDLAQPRVVNGLGQDLITHWGGALGNFGTHANVGAEWRMGWRLPDDFGSTPLRPAGENTAPPTSGSSDRRWAGHAFVTFDARWVLYDITLDGNTWKDSHSVDKRWFVADAGIGVAITKSDWKFALARYLRTREFDGQTERPVYGSFTISRKL